VNLGAENDTLYAGQGADTITLGAGTDTVIYDATNQSNAGARDTIADFDASGDVLFFDGLLSGTFAFVGSGAFTGGGSSEARFDNSSKLLSIDTDGNGSADMEITLTGVLLSNLSDADFIWT
jgi:Ca2+-binding RTX toxin-like protein